MVTWWLISAADDPARRRSPATDRAPSRRRTIVRICVVALGKIGLPLAVRSRARGHSVVGRIPPPAVALVNDGAAPFPGEANLDVGSRTS